MTEPIRIFDLENRLHEDESGTYRDQLCQELNDAQLTLKREMDRGLPPAEFDTANRYLTALETASNIVQQAWKLEHGSRL